MLVNSRETILRQIPTGVAAFNRALNVIQTRDNSTIYTQGIQSLNPRVIDVIKFDNDLNFINSTEYTLDGSIVMNLVELENLNLLSAVQLNNNRLSIIQDPSGNLVESKIVPDIGDGLIGIQTLPIIDTSDGGYIYGFVQSGGVSLLKFDATHSIDWQKQFVPLTSSSRYIIFKLRDTNFFIFGFTNTAAFPTIKTNYIFKLNVNNGSIVWQKAFQTLNALTAVELFCGFEDHEGSLVLVGSELQRVYKLDSNGNLVFSKDYLIDTPPISLIDYGYLACDFSNDNTYIIAGGVILDTPDGIILKLNTTGDIIWSKRTSEGFIYNVKVLASNDIAFVGESFDTTIDNKNQALIGKIGGDGEGCLVFNISVISTDAILNVSNPSFTLMDLNLNVSNNSLTSEFGNPGFVDECTVSPSTTPTLFPSASTKLPTMSPTPGPTLNPSIPPTNKPTLFPTISPTPGPSLNPSISPTLFPTISPTPGPSLNPSISPTLFPTMSPTPGPSLNPSISPTLFPTISPTPGPSLNPSISPTFQPTNNPTTEPTPFPTNYPTKRPTIRPNFDPTLSPTLHPTFEPTLLPTLSPTNTPTDLPSKKPTFSPTNNPTLNPSLFPSLTPTNMPTDNPSKKPTDFPSSLPSLSPSFLPSQTPSNTPSSLPSITPNFQAFLQETNVLFSPIAFTITMLLGCIFFCCSIFACLIFRRFLYSNNG